VRISKGWSSSRRRKDGEKREKGSTMDEECLDSNCEQASRVLPTQVHSAEL